MAKKRRKIKKARRSPKKRRMAKRRRRSSGRGTVTRGFRRAKSGIGGIFKSGIVGKIVLGVGAATLTGLAVDRFAPQFSGIARPAAAFLAGGPVGAIGSLLLMGGLGNLGGLLGGPGSPNGAGVDAV